MRLTVVGCAGSHPGPESACSAYLVEHDGFALLLDLGNGALGPLQKYLDPRHLDALYLSHLHGDHWLDLVPLAHLRRRHPAGPAPVLPVVVPMGERDRIAGAFGRPASGLDDVFAFREPADGQLGPFAVKVIRTAHPVETYAIRLTVHGTSLVYTADTGPFDALAPFASGADLLLAEAGASAPTTGPRVAAQEDVDRPLHLTGTDAGRLARQAAVGLLVVTHVAPWGDAALALDAARTAFGGDTTLACPGATYEL